MKLGFYLKSVQRYDLFLSMDQNPHGYFLILWVFAAAILTMGFFKFLSFLFAGEKNEEEEITNHHKVKKAIMEDGKAGEALQTMNTRFFLVVNIILVLAIHILFLIPVVTFLGRTEDHKEGKVWLLLDLITIFLVVLRCYRRGIFQWIRGKF